ncbi:MAG: UbiX family flavin prenyltransferase [Thermotogota bacterium]
MKKVAVGITGASGSIFAKKTIEKLVELGHHVHLVITDQGFGVIEHELNTSIPEFISLFENNIEIHNNDDMFSPIASGSYNLDSLIIVPCSMGTVAKITNGISDNLLCRAADVCIKEKINLTLVPRETPLNSIHLDNLLKLSKMNVNIVPPLPSFYDHPQSIDDIIDNSVGRILKSAGINNDFYKIWNGGD